MSAAWFVDGSYAYNCWKAVGTRRQIDYTRLRKEIEDDADMAIGEAYYFGTDKNVSSATQNSSILQNAFHRAIAIPPPDGPGLRVKLYWLQTKKLSWPQSLGGSPVMHPDYDDIQYELTSQKGVDVGLSFHLMRSFSKHHWKKLYLVAGDGDFHEVIQHLVENEGVEVTLIGTRSTISAELGPYCKLVYFDDIAEEIGR